jgi:hypothetical protein
MMEEGGEKGQIAPHACSQLLLLWLNFRHPFTWTCRHPLLQCKTNYRLLVPCLQGVTDALPGMALTIRHKSTIGYASA